MARKKRKIGFYYLTLVNNAINVADAFNTVINFINEKTRAEKTYNLGNNKFCLLDTYQEYIDNNTSKIIFKSATHSFRPKLIHRETINERESPKQIQEGEIEKTHIVIRIINDEILFVLEKHMNGISVNQFIKYLNYFSCQMEIEPKILFNYETMVKDNFLDEINQLNRVTCADIYVDKQLLGSNALNYSDRINQAKHEVILSVKAKNNDSIEDFALDLFAKFNGGDNVIRKIRIIGRNEENNEVILNTDFIERQEFIMPEINETTGELSSAEVFIEMNAVIENFN